MAKPDDYELLDLDAQAKYNELYDDLIINYELTHERIEELIHAKRRKLKFIINVYGAIKLVHSDVRIHNIR